MSLNNSALNAFQTASGVAADHLSLIIRMILLSSTFVWAAWCIYGELNHFRHHDIEIYDVMRKIFRMLVMVVLVMSLVFI